MKKSFFHGTTLGMRIGAAGFALAFLGVSLGFLGNYTDKVWLLLLALVVTAIGIIVGGFGIVYGWATLNDKQS